MNFKLVALLSVAILSLSFTNAARAISWGSQTASTVTITNLGTLGGTYTYGFGINDSGQVAGMGQTTGDSLYRAFVWSPDASSMLDIGTLGGTSSGAYGINEAGQVAGYSSIKGDKFTHAFVWSPDASSMLDIGTLGGANSYAYGINDAGQVAGYSSIKGDKSTHAFVWSPGANSMLDIGTLGGTNSYAYGINDAGQVAGYSQITGNVEYHSFLWDPSTNVMSDIGTLSGTNSYAYGINDAGLVAGSSRTKIDKTFITQAVFWDPGPGQFTGVMTGIGTLGGTSSGANGINDIGQVTGSSNTKGNETNHAFVWDDGALYDLNNFTTTLSISEYLQSADMFSINNKSQIVATSNLGKAYVLTPTASSPVPEPATIILFGAGIAGLVARRKKKNLKSAVALS